MAKEHKRAGTLPQVVLFPVKCYIPISEIIRVLELCMGDILADNWPYHEFGSALRLLRLFYFGRQLLTAVSGPTASTVRFAPQ